MDKYNVAEISDWGDFIARWDPVKRNHYETLVETVEYYAYLTSDNPGHILTKEQLQQLAEVRYRLSVFGTPGKNWATLADEIIHEFGNIKLNNHERI